MSMLSQTSARRIVDRLGLRAVDTVNPPTVAPPGEPMNPLALLPALGAPYEGGLFAGLTTDKEGRHFAVALLPDKPAKNLPWKKAVDWAASVGGVLPTRPVAALLFANAKDQFEPEWHWTSEAFDGSYAWGQSFYGYQDFTHKSYEGCARAVRLIQLTA